MKTIQYGLVCILVGVCVTLLVATCVDGGLVFVFASIVCTAGISLVAWIPLWWLVGLVILSIISLFRESPAKSSPPPAVSGQYVLTRYLEQEMARGRWSRSEIDERLRRNGWSNEAIQEAHNQATQRAQQAL